MNQPSQDRPRSGLATLLIVLLGLAVGLAVGAIAAGGGNDGGTRTVTVEASATPGPTSTPTPAVTAEAPAGDLEGAADDAGAKSVDPADTELRDQTPPDVPAAVLDAGQAKTDQAAAAAGVADTGPATVTGGGAQNYELRKDFSGHVYSDFIAGVTPTEFCLHYTVSSNVAGWGDVYGIRDYFARTRGASATFIADFEGHVLQMVPLTSKAWTQGAFNPYCRASVEIIATGRETRAEWLAAPLIRDGDLAALMRDVMGEYKLPLKFVDPVGCVAPAGYTDHNHIECGNTHTDVAPSFPFDELARQLRAGTGPRITGRDRRACRRITRHRANRRSSNPNVRARARRNQDAHRARVKALHGRGLRCTPQGDVAARNS